MKIERGHIYTSWSGEKVRPHAFIRKDGAKYVQVAILEAPGGTKEIKRSVFEREYTVLVQPAEPVLEPRRRETTKAYKLQKHNPYSKDYEEGYEQDSDSETAEVS
jgi:hypothetical protein